MGVQFFHSFKDDLGPFVHRNTARRIPTGIDCAVVKHGRVGLRVKQKPLRTGHIWVPPEEFTVTEGLVEFRMKFRGGPGAHGAGWLQDQVAPYADRTRHEIDVVENFGNPKVLHQGIWTQDDADPEPDQVVHAAWKGDAISYNVFGVDMRSDGYTFTVNDEAVLATSQYTSTQPKVLIASMLISDWEFEKYGVNNAWDQMAILDWVRVSD